MIVRLTLNTLFNSASLCRWRRLQRRLRGMNCAKALVMTAFGSIFLCLCIFGFHSAINGLDNKEVFDNSSAPPNLTWLRLREEILGRNETPTKVLLFSYMRGGSTLFSEIFNLDPINNVFWHEPMDAFYQSNAALEPHSIPQSLLYYKNSTRRIQDEIERQAITAYLDDLLSCRWKSLPVETFAHFHLTYSAAFREVYECMDKMKAKFMIFNCTFPLRPVCGQVDLVRRDMSVSERNGCQRIIRLIRSTMSKELSVVERSPVTSTDSRSTTATRMKLGTSAKYFRHAVATEIRKMLSSLDQTAVFSNETEKAIPLLIDHRECMAELEPVLSRCLDPVQKICHRAKLISLKVIRVMFDQLEDLIQRNPDIHVVYYVRDPRAVASSRSKPGARLTMSSKDQSATAESKVLCSRMMKDVRAKKYLDKRYPGSIITVRYEDFIREPERHVREIFGRIGRPVPTAITQWISSRFEGMEDNGVYGTVRVDPVATSVNWMAAATVREALEMDLYCRDVLNHFGYFRFLPEARESVDEPRSLFGHVSNSA